MAKHQWHRIILEQLKRAHMGTFHKISPKHLQRYIKEFTGRHDISSVNTLDQMGVLAYCMIGERLKYET